MKKSQILCWCCCVPASLRECLETEKSSKTRTRYRKFSFRFSDTIKIKIYLGSVPVSGSAPSFHKQPYTNKSLLSKKYFLKNIRNTNMHIHTQFSFTRVENDQLKNRQTELAVQASVTSDRLARGLAPAAGRTFKNQSAAEARHRLPANLRPASVLTAAAPPTPAPPARTMQRSGEAAPLFSRPRSLPGRAAAPSGAVIVLAAIRRLLRDGAPQRVLRPLVGGCF